MNEILEQVRNFGYEETQIDECFEKLHVHEIGKYEFQQQINDPKSELYKAYNYFPTIKMCGSLEYAPELIISILEIEEKEAFLLEFFNPSSRVHRKYLQGKLESNFKTDIELKKDVESGNKDAIKLYDRRKQQNEYNELKQELFGV